MKYLPTILAAAILLSNSQVIEARPSAANGMVRPAVNWQSSYEAALEQAKAHHLPLLLFFTGSDWCTWCNKLEEEVLVKREFADAVGDKFVFVRLDFPLYEKLPPRVNEQNQALRKRFSINSFPTLLVVDDHERVIGKTGYQAGGAQKFAAQLSSIVDGYLEYRRGWEKTNKQKLSHEELRGLYEKAQALHQEEEAREILLVGVHNDKDHYFQCEQYRNLIEEGQSHTAQAQALRNQILGNGNSSERHLHYKIAVIEYQAMSEEEAPEKASAPLVAYLEKFADVDRENGWKVEMTISQTFLAKGRYAEALEHARVAQKTAPATVRPDLDKAVEQIKIQMREKGLPIPA